MVSHLGELEPRRHTQIAIAPNSPDDSLDGRLHMPQERMADVADSVDLALRHHTLTRDSRSRLDVSHPRLRRQPKAKDRSAANLALHRQIAAHQPRQSSADREAEPASFSRPRMPAFRQHE